MQGVLVVVVFATHLWISHGWWDQGHVLVAEMSLHLVDQTVRDQIESTLWDAGLPDFDTAPAASLWPDVIKADSLYSMSTWHYIDQPYQPEGGPISPPPPPDAIWALNQCVTTLKAVPGGPWEKAFSLRWLLHLVGDVHQPFHCISLFNGRFGAPLGDLGGNKFAIKYGTFHNLHSFWDSCAGQYTERAPIPLTQSYKAMVSSQADAILAQHPTPPPEGNFTSWAQESYDLAVQYGYGNLTYGQELDTAYVNAAKQICKAQMARAAYRLSMLLPLLTVSTGGSRVPQPTPASSPSDQLSNGAVVGITSVAWLVVLGICGGFGFVWYRRRAPSFSGELELQGR